MQATVVVQTPPTTIRIWDETGRFGMAYRLVLTDVDWTTIEFIGGRYCWSGALLAKLPAGVPLPGDEAAQLYSIPEHVAWDIVAAFQDDTEGGHSPFPMLDPGSVLYAKLEWFWDEVV